MRRRQYTVGPLANASANNIATSQTPTSAVTLNGSTAVNGVAVLDTYRSVRITTGGSEAGKTMTLVGNTFGNAATSEVVTLPSSATTVDSVTMFKTITSATMSAAAGAALTIGTNGVSSSPWFGPDLYSDSSIGIQIVVSGTVNYTVQQTGDDPNDPTNSVVPYAVAWTSSTDTNVVAATASQQTNYLFLPSYIRVLMNSNSNPGLFTVTFIQSGQP